MNKPTQISHSESETDFTPKQRAEFLVITLAQAIIGTKESLLEAACIPNNITMLAELQQAHDTLSRVAEVVRLVYGFDWEDYSE